MISVKSFILMPYLIWPIEIFIEKSIGYRKLAQITVGQLMAFKDRNRTKL